MLETQDIFDQLLGLDTQDDTQQNVPQLGAPFYKSHPHPVAPPVAHQASNIQLPAAQHHAPQPGPPVTPQLGAPQLGAPQAMPPPAMPPQHGAPQQPPHMQSQQQPPQGQAQGQSQQPGPQGDAAQAEAGGVSALVLHDLQSPSVEAKNEWRVFGRLAANRSKFPVGLQAAYKADKTDLFNTWRRCGKDLGKTEASVKRNVAKLTEALGEKSLVKVRDLVKDGMPLERALAFREKRKKENLCVADAGFPDIEDEISFWHTTKVATSTINRTEKSMEVKGTTDVQGAELEDLIGDEGVLCAGLHVAVPGVATKNQMAFAESLGNLVTNEGKENLS